MIRKSSRERFERSLGNGIERLEDEELREAEGGMPMHPALRSGLLGGEALEHDQRSAFADEHSTRRRLFGGR